ncbi:MAG: SUF system Fe-S cluster assembly protein [Gammaproteobacteria bacterium]|nr:SUF system Fe-S cluster assembly protein [Gammaproteobacteria bacterium]
MTPTQAARNHGLQDDTSLEDRVVAALKTVFDPEISVNIHDLGLIYNVSIDDHGRVDIRMTLTSPACPVAGTLPCEVEQRVLEVVGVSAVTVELVWDPPWTRARMSEAAQLELGLL